MARLSRAWCLEGVLVVKNKLIDRWSQDLCDKADTARNMPWAIIGWTLSLTLRACARVIYGKREN